MIFRRKTPADLARIDAELNRFSRQSPVSFSLLVTAFGILLFLVALILTNIVQKACESL